ncbi:hypothetical protein MBLNU13_g02937t2 [Cladosporium sp. NU13]
MDSVRNPSREPAAERQPFLQSPLLVNDHDGGNTAVASNDPVTTDAVPYTTPRSRAKLGTCALNFFLSGIAVAGVGACALFVELSAQTWAFRNDRGTGNIQDTSNRNFKIRSLLRNSSLWLCGAYFLVYQGIEASLNDWIVLFLVRTRHADTATAASASSVFWLGEALGRYALGAVTEYVGLHISVSSYIIIACCAQIILMSLRQIPATLAVLGVCGFFLAPLFPSGIVMLSTRTPPENRTRIIAAAIALGQIGGALVPYGLGLLATHLGTQYLFHVTLGLSILLLGTWAAISRVGVASEAEETSV